MTKKFDKTEPQLIYIQCIEIINFTDTVNRNDEGLRNETGTDKISKLCLSENIKIGYYCSIIAD